MQDGVRDPAISEKDVFGYRNTIRSMAKQPGRIREVIEAQPAAGKDLDRRITHLQATLMGSPRRINPIGPDDIHTKPITIPDRAACQGQSHGINRPP